MTSSSPRVSPLGLAQARRRASGPERRLHVVAHNGAYNYGGAEHVLVNLLHGLQERGHQVTLCCNSEKVADAAVRRLVPAIHMPLRGDLMLSDALRFARFLRRDRPDAVLIGTFKKIWLGGYAAKRAGVERVIARVGLASDVARRLKYRVALRRFIDGVVLNAKAMRTSFLASTPGYDPARVTTIYNGITPPRSSRPGALRQELGIAPGVPVIGTVARLVNQKRLERQIALTARLEHAHLIIAGEGYMRPQLEQQIGEAGLERRVHLLGQRSDIGDVLSALDLFVLSSDQEGMSNAMLEALWCGVPVVSTPVAGTSEALEPMSGGQAPGRVAAGFTVDDIHREVSRLLDDRMELRRMSVAAETRARERFDHERTVDQWEAVLRDGPVLPG